MSMIYGSVCSGIEAATVAWHPLGWRAAWLAEIEAFPSAVLDHHYPGTPNLGDMTRLAAMVISNKIDAPDILVGGTPCQAFSVAGMRQGLDDPRGALTIKYVELLDAIDHVRERSGKPAAVAVWENVPGVLSDKGNAFGCFLGALAGEDCELQPSGKRWTDAGCVYGPKRAIAWRVLDAQYFGLAQRRRRVFVVASARDGFDPSAVLFEREGVRRDTAPRRGEGQDVAGRAPFGPALQCGCGYLFGESLGEYGCPNCEGDEGPAVSVIAGVPAFGGENQGGSLFQAGALTAHGLRNDFASETFCVAPATASGFEITGPITACGGTTKKHGFGWGQQEWESGFAVPVSVHCTQDPGSSGNAFIADDYKNGTFAASETARPLTTSADRSRAAPVVVTAFSCKDYGGDATADLSPTLRAMGHDGSHANAGGQVAVCVTGDITHTLKAEGFDGSEDGTGRGQPIVPVIAFDSKESNTLCNVELSPCLTTNGEAGKSGGRVAALTGSAVRRLTPTECERLQGFSDNYTLIPWRGKPAEECPDGPRYKAIGNSKAVPVVRWIGRRIQQQIE